eukprot:450145-Rhodomonas_salina.1
MQSIPSVAVPPTPTAAHVEVPVLFPIVYPEGIPGADQSLRFDCQRRFDESLLGTGLKPSKNQIMSFMNEAPEFSSETEVFDDSIFVFTSDPNNMFNTL